MKKLDSRRLTLDKNFIPAEILEGDEFFPNGILEFNITRLNRVYQK